MVKERKVLTGVTNTPTSSAREAKKLQQAIAASSSSSSSSSTEVRQAHISIISQILIFFFFFFYRNKLPKIDSPKLNKSLSNIIKPIEKETPNKKYVS